MAKKYKVVLTKRARRDLKKKDPDIRKQLIETAEKLGKNPRPQSSKLMKGRFKGYRREGRGITELFMK